MYNTTDEISGIVPGSPTALLAPLLPDMKLTNWSSPQTTSLSL